MITAVFPDPGPASTSAGPAPWQTAFFCDELSCISLMISPGTRYSICCSRRICRCVLSSLLLLLSGLPPDFLRGLKCFFFTGRTGKPGSSCTRFKRGRSGGLGMRFADSLPCAVSQLFPFTSVRAPATAAQAGEITALPGLPPHRRRSVRRTPGCPAIR